MSQIDLRFHVDTDNPAPQTRACPHICMTLARCLTGVYYHSEEEKRKNPGILDQMQMFLNAYRHNKTFNDTKVLEGVWNTRHIAKRRLSN